MRGFCDGSVVKNPPANAEDMSSVPGLGISPGEGKGNPFQYSWIELINSKIDVCWTVDPPLPFCVYV